MHDQALVSGGDDHPVFLLDDEIAARGAIAVVGDLVEEAWLVKVDQAAQRPDDRALRVTDGDGDADDRGYERPAEYRVSDRGPAVEQGAGDVVAVDIVEANPLRNDRRRGDCRSVVPVGVDPGVEQVVQDKALVEEALQGIGASSVAGSMARAIISSALMRSFNSPSSCAAT